MPDIFDIARIHPDIYKKTVEDLIDKHKHFHNPKFDAFADKCDVTLLSIQTVFPFDLFPDSLIIDPIKITVKIREFFKSEEIRSILIRDISNIIVDTSWYFAEMKIFQTYDTQNPIIIKYLKRQEAIKARDITQGLVALCKENIDITDFLHNNPSEAQVIENLGKAHERK